MEHGFKCPEKSRKHHDTEATLSRHRAANTVSRALSSILPMIDQVLHDFWFRERGGIAQVLETVLCDLA